MNRRAFLATLAAGMSLDAERLLWRRGMKTISIPKPPKLFRVSLVPPHPYGVEILLLVNGQPYEFCSSKTFPLIRAGDNLSVTFKGAVKHLPVVMFEGV